MDTSDLDAVLAPHPVIEQLSRAANREDNTGAVSVTGFIGKAEDPDRVRIYSSLEFLDYWIEVNRADILHATVVNQEFRRVAVWLRANAHVVRSPVPSGDPLAAGTAPSDREMTAVNRGRLRALVRRGVATAMLSGATGPSGGGPPCSFSWPCFF